MLDFDQLVARSHQFHTQIHAFPTSANRLQTLGTRNAETRKRIAQQAQQVRVLVHHETLRVIQRFLTRKATDRSDVEQRLYREMSPLAFVQRCIEKRPLVFMTASDFTVTRDGKTTLPCAVNQWQRVGTTEESAPLVLQDYLSYEEMAISSLLGVSTPSFFINSGARDNGGEPMMNQGEFQSEGIVMALVGARIENRQQMESRFVLQPRDQHQFIDDEWQEMYAEETLLALYDRKHKHQQRFFEVPHMPNQRFDAFAYRKRMRITFELLLHEAQVRAQEQSKRAYVHVVGLGLGVWHLLKQVQSELFVDEFLDVLQSGAFDHVAVIDFAWISPPSRLVSTAMTTTTAARGISTSLCVTTSTNHTVQILFSKNPPAQKLSPEFLLVASYAWDGNAFPGNEYWTGSLSASGDPAMACCSTIAELQNPCVNHPFTGNIEVVGAANRRSNNELNIL